MTNINSIYCENLASTFHIAEPINTITNISFFIATFMLFKTYKKQKNKQLDIIFLISLLFLIGLGSTIWHLTQSFIGELLDMIPILLFLIIYIYSFSRKIIKLKWYYTFLILILFIFATFNLPSLFDKDPIKTSSGYLPALLILFIFTIYTYYKNKYVYKDLLTSSLIFIVSIILRSLDFVFCNTLIIGTHFLWHILNGILLYILINALIKYYKKNK